MGWNNYDLDREAQKLVLAAKNRDRESLNQAFKMRVAVAYGLERFWGEHLRLKEKKSEKEKAQSQYWKETWDTLVRVMANATISIPNDSVDTENTQTVQAMASKLWQLDIQDQRITLAVLTQLCDCLIWWTQRYK